MSDQVSLTLTHDTQKELKGGKRRYSDADGHNIYLTGEEVKELGSPSSVTLTVQAS